jgi:hypothetical protein
MDSMISQVRWLKGNTEHDRAKGGAQVSAKHARNLGEPPTC